MTLEGFDRKLAREGKTIKEWCDEYGVDLRTVYNIRQGVNKGRYGKGYQALLAMKRYASAREAA